MRLVTIAREGVLRVDGAPLGGAAGALADDPNRRAFSRGKAPEAKT